MYVCMYVPENPDPIKDDEWGFAVAELCSPSLLSGSVYCKLRLLCARYVAVLCVHV